MIQPMEEDSLGISYLLEQVSLHLFMGFTTAEPASVV